MPAIWQFLILLVPYDIDNLHWGFTNVGPVGCFDHSGCIDLWRYYCKKDLMTGLYVNRFLSYCPVFF